MNSLALLSLLLTLASVFGFINRVTLRLPDSIGVLVIALTVSLGVIAVDPFIPGVDLGAVARRLLGTVDLPVTLMNGALSFLLFAGSLHVDLGELLAGKTKVAALAVLGTLIAVALIAGAMWLVFELFGLDVAPVWCVVLGAVLAPTDPVVVVGMLKRLGLPPALQAVFAGESLFNDGVGVVVFGVALGVATGSGDATGTDIASAFLFEAVGAMLLGALCGWLALEMLRRVDEYKLELTISLALATGTFSLANALGMSGPIAVVMAGLAVGSLRGQGTLSEDARRQVMLFWALVDDVLNTLLFLLIGFEVIAVPFSARLFAAGACAVPLALVVRAISVIVPTLPLTLRSADRMGALAVLTWGGQRGGISIALALSLPDVPARPALQVACYMVVVFNIVVQGLTMPRLVRRFYKAL